MRARSLIGRRPPLGPAFLSVQMKSLLAGVAQWQSTCFVNRKLQVRIPSPAQFSPCPKVRERMARESASIARRWSPSAGPSFPNARWCNGSTADSDSACLGSSPSRAAIFFAPRAKKWPAEAQRAKAAGGSHPSFARALFLFRPCIFRPFSSNFTPELRIYSITFHSGRTAKKSKNRSDLDKLY